VVGTVAAPAPARIRSVEEEKEEESREGRVPAVRDLPASPHRSTVQAVPPYRPAVQTTPLPPPPPRQRLSSRGEECSIHRI
jgi:hypothetical protein